MSKTTITRKFTFDAGHRVLGHEGKCRHLHGHTYTAEVTVRSTTHDLDTIGRVIDFSVLKEKVGGWIDANLDHVTVLNTVDPLYGILVGNGQRVYYMYVNPTAENLAALVYHQTNRLLNPDAIECVNVRVWETPNCFADYSEEN